LLLIGAADELLHAAPFYPPRPRCWRDVISERVLPGAPLLVAESYVAPDGNDTNAGSPALPFGGKAPHLGAVESVAVSGAAPACTQAAANPENHSLMSSPQRILPATRARDILSTLGFLTLVCTGMLVVRFVCAGNLRFSGLFGNLLLAWIPMVLSIVLWRMPRDAGRLRFWSAMVVWVLFFPNAFYLVTDLIHMKKFGADGIFRWFDMLLTTSFAAGGMFLGCCSLYLLHLRIRQQFDRRAGWLFAGGMLALGSIGIYLGRALRLNSWDVVANPLKLASKVAGLIEPASAKEVCAFSVTFFFFSFAVYWFVVSVARLHEGGSAIEDGPVISRDV
jgi:uncharacterized membrane protein